MELTQEDIKNVLAIISRPTTTIQANEATTVAILQQKLGGMIATHNPEAKKGSKQNPMTPEEFKEKHGIDVSDSPYDESKEETAE